ncbi:MAG: hypothetical protein L6Q49_15085 [Anaerolineales bacterium]|nr:hypothetical protein [Anaerolineales bacterium]
MSEPIIFIAHQKVKQGKAEEYKKVYQEVGEWMKANKPQTAAHIAYISEDGTEASVVHIFPDIEAMEKHMQNLGNVGAKAFSLMEIVGFDVYGTPSKMVLDSMLKMIPGAKVTMKTQSAGGYIRLMAG